MDQKQQQGSLKYCIQSDKEQGNEKTKQDLDFKYSIRNHGTRYVANINPAVYIYILYGFRLQCSKLIPLWITRLLFDNNEIFTSRLIASYHASLLLPLS